MTQFDVYQRAGGTISLLVRDRSAAGNAGFDALFSGASPDGPQVFFETDEQLAADDTDVYVDVYERSGATITQALGRERNGAFDATFAGAAADGSHVSSYETEEQLVAAGHRRRRGRLRAAPATRPQLVSTGPAGGNGAVDAFFAECLRATARASSSPPRRAWSRPTPTPSRTSTSAPAARPLRFARQHRR